jgi:hypothetical protein
MTNFGKLAALVASSALMVAIAACGDSDSTTSSAGGGDTGGGTTTNAGGGTTTGTDGGGGAAGVNNCLVDDKYDPAYICTTYGAAVPDVVDEIVTLALADDRFAPDFQAVVDGGDTRVAEFKKNLGDFIVTAYGCADTYTGPDMVTAHANIAIDKQHYTDFLLDIVAKALLNKGVPADDVNNCFAPPLLPDGDLAKTIINK